MGDFTSMIGAFSGFPSSATASYQEFLGRLQSFGQLTPPSVDGGCQNPLADVESLGGALPPFPQAEGAYVQSVQQGFSEVEQARKTDIEEELAARADAYYASLTPPETPDQRVARIEGANRAKEALLGQINQRETQFSQYVQYEMSKLDRNAPDYQQKAEALQARLSREGAELESQHHRALLKSGLPPELHGVVDQKVNDYEAMQRDHQQQLESLPEYQVLKEYQEQQLAYARSVRERLASQH